jgi:hypothetical protein
LLQKHQHSHDCGRFRKSLASARRPAGAPRAPRWACALAANRWLPGNMYGVPRRAGPGEQFCCTGTSRAAMASIMGIIGDSLAGRMPVCAAVVAHNTPHAERVHWRLDSRAHSRRASRAARGAHTRHSMARGWRGRSRDSVRASGKGYAASQGSRHCCQGGITAPNHRASLRGVTLALKILTGNTSLEFIIGTESRNFISKHYYSFFPT